MLRSIYDRIGDMVVTQLKKPYDRIKYDFVYPLVERITYRSQLEDAANDFTKNTLQRTKNSNKIPFYIHSKQSKAFQDFCRSEIDEYGFESNKTSLCMLLGPSGAGKTTFLRYNLQRLSQMKATSKVPTKSESNEEGIVVVESKRVAEDSDWFNISSFNCAALSIINFDTFLFQFERLLVNSILKQLTKVATHPDLYPMLPGEEPFDPIKIIKNVLYDCYAKEFLNIYGRDMIQAIINNSDIFVSLDDELKPVLSEIFNVKMVEENQDFSEVFESIIEAIAHSFKGDQTLAALNLGVSLLARIEYESRSSILKDSYSRTGVLVNGFLFDLLNYLEGYHQKNTTSRQFAQNVLAIENFDALFSGYSTDKRFLDFQDHLFMRLYSVQSERDHFPIIIESSNSRFFTKELYEMMHINYTTFGCIEIYGFPVESLTDHFSSLFSKREVNILQKIIGINSQTWTSLIKSVANQKKINFSAFIDLKNNYFETEYARFLSLLNSVYLDNTVADLLDGLDVQDEDFYSENKPNNDNYKDKLILYYILDVFEVMIWNFGTFQMGSKYAEQRILENAVVKALISANIFYTRYYYSYLTFHKYIYVSLAKRYIEETKSAMTLMDRLRYWNWRRRNGIEKRSLTIQQARGLKTQKEIPNSKNFQNFKIESEHLQFRGVEFKAEIETMKVKIFKLLFKSK